jgi:hypothetical protein
VGGKQESLSEKQTKSKSVVGVAQVVEHLLQVQSPIQLVLPTPHIKNNNNKKQWHPFFPPVSMLMANSDQDPGMAVCISNPVTNRLCPHFWRRTWALSQNLSMQVSLAFTDSQQSEGAQEREAFIWRAGLGAEPAGAPPRCVASEQSPPPTPPKARSSSRSQESLLTHCLLPDCLPCRKKRILSGA